MPGQSITRKSPVRRPSVAHRFAIALNTANKRRNLDELFRGGQPVQRTAKKAGMKKR